MVVDKLGGIKTRETGDRKQGFLSNQVNPLYDQSVFDLRLILPVVGVRLLLVPVLDDFRNWFMSGDNQMLGLLKFNGSILLPLNRF